jgi:hypothetical protein
MKTKEYIFSMKFGFVAKSEKDARDDFQEMLDDWELDHLLDVDNWSVQVEDVEVSEIKTLHVETE